MGNNKYKILIVEDEANIRSFIKANLETSDYQVLCAETCELGMMMYASHHPDLIVLDLGLPDRDGMSLIQEVRKTDTVPIIVLSARSNERDKVEALDLGANDYITKPFAAEELVARMESVLRRTGRGGRELRAYDVVLDTVDRVARQNGEPLDLRRREFDLLELLMRNRGAALYRDVIFERVWGELPDTESLRTVDTHIARLRKKLGWTDKQIETVFKIGYRLRKE